MDFNNLEDLYEYVHDNIKEVFGKENEGEIIDFPCPICNKETKGKILKDGNIECQNCKNVIIIKENIISD